MTLQVYSATSVFFGQPGLYINKSAQYICQFTLLDFRIILDWFLCLPNGKPTPVSQPGKFLKFLHFSWWVKQAPPGYWDRVYESLLKILPAVEFFIISLTSGFTSMSNLVKICQQNMFENAETWFVLTKCVVNISLVINLLMEQQYYVECSWTSNSRFQCSCREPLK